MPHMPAAAADNSGALYTYLKKVLPTRGLKMECITLIQEEDTKVYEQYAVQEKHGGSCPGDPETSPIIDRYRIIKKGQSIQVWNAPDDTWQPLTTQNKSPLSPPP